MADYTERRFERCVEIHPHPLGLLTQRRLWPAMLGLHVGVLSCCSTCKNCMREGVYTLRCTAGCDWGLCGKCAQVSLRTARATGDAKALYARLSRPASL